MDYTCIGIYAVIALAVIAIYYWRFHGYDYQAHEPLYFDQDDPADEYEYRCIQHQRTTGRERGGPLIWKDED